MSDQVLERALLAVGRTRALGLHFYGHFLGIEGRPPRDGLATLGLTGEPPGVGDQGCSSVAVATLADLALGAAIRSTLRPGERLGTVTFSVQHVGGDQPGPLEARASNVSVVRGQGTAQCTVYAGERMVAVAQGRFAALPPLDGQPMRLMPWEHHDPPPTPIPPLPELTERERAAVDAALAAGQRATARSTAVSREIVNFRWDGATSGRAAGALAIGPELANRVGHIQGGALYGAAALAAFQALGDPNATLADGHFQFLRPSDGATLRAEGSVLRSGRTIAYAEARLLVDQRLVGTGLFSFRP